MKSLINFLIIAAIALPAFWGVTGCKKENTTNPQDTVPSLITQIVTGITHKGAVSGGEITDDKGNQIIIVGVCWSTNPGPTILDDRTIDGSYSGPYNSMLTGLIPNKKYYVRSYARGTADTWYGNELNFTTSAAPVQFFNAKIDGNLFQSTEFWVADHEWEVMFSGEVGYQSLSIKAPTDLTTGAHDLSEYAEYYVKFGDNDIARTWQSTSGTLNIDEYDLVSGKISGTFECIATDYTGTSTRNITEGAYQIYLF